MRAARAVLAALVLTLGALAVPVGADEGFSTTRVAGRDRYSTAVALAQRSFPHGAREVVVASGEGFADSLAAGPVAAHLGAPLLLTARQDAPAATMDEIRRLDPDRIVIAGGTAAVSANVEWALGHLAPVHRVAGADRSETSARLSADLFGTGAPVAFLASGRTFADALAAGAAAARLGGPVLLVERDGVPASVQAELERLRPARIVLVGGSAVVGQGVADDVAWHEDVVRVAGADRYETAGKVAELAPADGGVAFVAAGSTFADALAAGPSAATAGAPLVLTDDRCLRHSVAQELADQGVEDLVVVGGTAAVKEGAADPCEPVTRTTTTTTTVPSTTVPPPVTTTPTVPSPVTTTTTTPVPVAPTVPSLAPRGAIPADSPDPTVIEAGGTYYAYSTQVGLNVMPLRTSTDLVTWSPPGNAMPQLASWVDFAYNWAPSISAVSGGYVIWYTARDHASGRQCVSRATSASPAGPFVDELTAPPVCQVDLGGSIDPHLFTDTDGSRYLYWKSDENALGNPSRIWMAAVSADGRTLTTAPTAVLSQSAPWETPTMEQPSVTRVGATYYLFYSGGWWESDTYAIGYATSPSPLGPFTKRTADLPWLASSSGALGPGALDVFTGPGGALWATYHAWPGTPSYAAGGSRTTRVGELRFS